MTPQTSNTCRRAIVLDTSAFVAGYDPFSSKEEQMIAPKVEAEIRRNSMVKMRFEAALESSRIKSESTVTRISKSS